MSSSFDARNARDGLDGSRGLDERSRGVLDLERRWSADGGTKARVIRQRLGISPTRYHQLLARAIDLPEALAYDPMLVRRLRRLREARRSSRGGRPDAAARHGAGAHR
jgi:hypothetical protein